MPYERTKRVVLALALGAVATLTTVAAPAGAKPAPLADSGATGDLLIANYSFESGTDGWILGHAETPVPRPSRACASAATVSAEQHVAGSQSLRLAGVADCRDPGALSSAVPAQAGRLYHGYLQAFAAATGGVTSRLVFRDSADQVLKVATSPSGPDRAGAWTPLSATGVAPSGTATVALAVVLSPSSPGPVFVDDALVSGQYTDLGAQITSSSINATTIGVDGQGRSTGYAVVTGNDSYAARLIGVDAVTGDITTDVALPGATGAWNATTATDGKIYVGSYNYDDPTENGRLYQYTPGADAAVDLGNPIAGDTFIWDVTAGPNGSVFGGGYPSGGAFKYVPGSGYQQVGSRPLVSPEQYARTVAYDASTDILYVGIGAHAHLMACPGGGSQCTDILPAQYANEEFAYSVSAGDGYVFANMGPSGDGHLVVLKVNKGADGSLSSTVIRDIPKVKYPGASAVINGSVYLVASSKLSRYDIATDTLTSLGTGLPVGPRAWGFDGAGALMTMGNASGVPDVVRYDTATGALTSVKANGAPSIATDIQSIQAGPDGKIYSSGFRSGAVGVYTPMRSDESLQSSGISQAEGSTVLDGTIYWGTYPGAVIYAYQPSEPWKAGTNPKVVCSLTAQDQDRPYGMVSGGGKVYIGTEAGYGKLAGALSVYDPATGQCTTQQNIVADETVASLAYLDGKVYGGTSIWGGLGIAPTQTEAKLLIYDTATGSSQALPLPTRGLRTVLAVTVGPDHRIWMVAEDHVLVYDPTLQRFVVDKELFPELGIHGDDLIDAHDAFLTVGRDGNLYGTIHSSYLYRLDPVSLRVTILQRGNVHHVVQDGYGNLYYVQDGYGLRRLAI